MLLGCLGRDPEIKFFDNGGSVCSFSIATSESFKKNEKWEERTEWHRISVFNKTAEACSTYLKKGSSVYVEGRMQTRSYQDKDGVEKFITEIVAYEVKFLDKKGE